MDEGRALLDELLSSLPADAVPSFAIVAIAIAYAHLHLAQGNPEALFAGLEERIRPFREAGFKFLLADEHWLRGRAALALGQVDAARESLLKAKDAAEAQEERAILWKILATQSELERGCGEQSAADDLRDQARVVVEDIAAHAGEMREAFLAQPAGAQLLGVTWEG